MRNITKVLSLFLLLLTVVSFTACAGKKVTIANNYQISESEYKEYFENESTDKNNIIFENGIFGATIKTPNAYYIGKLKDNKAHGLGTSLYVYTYNSAIGGKIYVCELLKGKFFDGKFIEGKQYLFDCYERDTFGTRGGKNYKQSPLLSNVDTFIDESMVDYNLTSEGTFVANKSETNPGGEKKEYWKYVLNGQGIQYDASAAMTAVEKDDKGYKAKKHYEGQFKDGLITNGKEYCTLTNTILTYEGEFKSGKYDGKGKLYDFITGELKYEGIFENGDIKK